MDPSPRSGNQPERRDRLHPVDMSKALAPFRKASSVNDCHLYWIPISSWPAPNGQRAWLLEFLGKLHAVVESKTELRGEFFLDYHVAEDFERLFLKSAIELAPFLGLARRPGTSLPKGPTQQELKDAAQGRSEFDLKKHMPTYCYWFLNQDLARLLPLFFGHGGTSMMYLAPDPGAKPPKIPYLDEIKEIFPTLPFDKLEAMSSAAASMGDGFLKKSKLLFGTGLEEEPQYDGLPFIVPLLEAGDFTRQPQQERQNWFELFELHWRESPADRGLFLASKLDIEEDIIGLLEQMKEAGHIYPVA